MEENDFKIISDVIKDYTRDEDIIINMILDGKEYKLNKNETIQALNQKNAIAREYVESSIHSAIHSVSLLKKTSVDHVYGNKYGQFSIGVILHELTHVPMGHIFDAAYYDNDNKPITYIFLRNNIASNPGYWSDYSDRLLESIVCHIKKVEA